MNYDFFSNRTNFVIWSLDTTLLAKPTPIILEYDSYYIIIEGQYKNVAYATL
ncbi:hypothetical protein Ctaglu_21870 [Clostridium tagluense]|uniref:Uncharacterized protein n=1 Tax=Clostridium tagluense TaxID=360422 RepID=A0A401UM13_9CLOT|nr:hypothetical protein Ctaglu_21870 [Clostridium tagluense]